MTSELSRNNASAGVYSQRAFDRSKSTFVAIKGTGAESQYRKDPSDSRFHRPPPQYLDTAFCPVLYHGAHLGLNNSPGRRRHVEGRQCLYIRAAEAILVLDSHTVSIGGVAASECASAESQTHLHQETVPNSFLRL